MFSLLENSSLSEFLAPQVSPLEEFISQWQSFMYYFSEQRSRSVDLCKCQVESTNLSDKLSKMLTIVIEEQAECQPGCISSSVEFMLQNRVLHTLAVIAQADAPLGICPRIMIFFVRLIEDCNAVLLPHREVYSALNKLIIVCGKLPAGPYESTEMLLLSSVTDTICSNPLYLNFFLKDGFPLMNSLLALLLCADSNIQKISGTCIVKLICLLDDTANQMIVQRTPFCSKIVAQVVNHYQDIPRSLQLTDVELALCFFTQESSTDSSAQTSPLPDCRSLSNSARLYLCFLKWYLFVDTLLHHSPSQSLISKALLSQFRADFLESCIVPDLIGEGFANEQDAVDNIFLTTFLLSHCLRNTESNLLFTCISEFLTIPDELESNLPNKHKNYDLYEKLLARCRAPNVHLDEEKNKSDKTIQLKSITLQLFEDMLTRPSRRMVDQLLVRPLSTTYESESNDTVEQLDQSDISPNFSERFNFHSMHEEMQAVASQIGKMCQFTTLSCLTLSRLEETLFYFASLLPNELKASETPDYESYLRDAIKGVQAFITTSYVHWQSATTGEDDSSNKSHTSQNNLIDTVLDNLDSVVELPYEMKLQVFSLIAKMTLIPDTNIELSLLEPSLSSHKRTLFAVLHRLVEKLQVSVHGIDHLNKQLQITKRSLLEGETKSKHLQQQQQNDTVQSILQSIIILDEFCKELVSIIYAKNYILGLCKQGF